jgi:hypothetical protein
MKKMRKKIMRRTKRMTLMKDLPIWQQIAWKARMLRGGPSKARVLPQDYVGKPLLLLLLVAILLLLLLLLMLLLFPHLFQQISVDAVEDDDIDTHTGTDRDRDRDWGGTCWDGAKEAEAEVGVQGEGRDNTTLWELP